MLLAVLLAVPWSMGLAAADTAYVGSAACAGCHEEAYRAWRSSHHYQAMLPATPESVLGAFDGRTFEYAGTTSRFFRDGQKYLVETDDENGALKTFEIAYTFGFFPLQQYLVPFPGGRYQALNIVWDSRPEAEGGQRWIHLYPDNADEPVRHDDLVHWTGSFQNWNSRCAACHSTGLEKNYKASSRSYDTRWQEINVACEACHGPAATHLEWAQTQSEGEAPKTTGPLTNKGFEFSLDDRGPFGPAPDGSTDILSRQDGKRPFLQVETCAGCHSRRSELTEGQPGNRFDDRYRLSLIEPGLYFPDGQVRDEVYVYGSFLQSKMYAAGVVCTNCHEPHSNAVRASDNSLCSQCHAASVYDQATHHHHDPDGPGAACVNCHMPSRTYMVVDDRRDHGFHVPEPRLTIDLGIPNACNQCHRDRDAQWAAESLAGWNVGSTIRARHAPVLAAAWGSQATALPDLLGLANDPQQPAILRASAVLASADFPIRDTLPSLAQVLYSDDNLVRTAAVRAIQQLPAEQRYALLKSLVDDPVKSVRMAVARQLVDVPLAQLPADESTALTNLRREYLEALRHNADMPEEQMNIGFYYLASGDPAAAEKAYREALRLAPAFVPALLNLADLYRANGLDEQAQPLLQRAIDLAPGDANPQHAMGLLLIRQRKLDAALGYLQQAAELAPSNIRYLYVYGVALWETGQQQKAVAILEAGLASHPGNRDLMSALGSYYQQLGETEKLRALQR
jgi:predicted CXXCH cytochrome family protein